MSSYYLPTEKNFLALPPELSNPEKAGVIVIPVPFEQTSSYGHGSAKGPEAILEASHQVEIYDTALGIEPAELLGGIVTRRPLAVDGLDGDELSRKLHAVATEEIRGNRFVVTVGGEHTSVIGAVRAHCESFKDVTVLQLDAHSDLRPSYEESIWSHACAMTRVWDFHQSIVQVGIRSQEKSENEWSKERNIPVFYAHQIHQKARSGDDWISEIVSTLGPKVYLTFDCDVFDPSVIPSTGTPEPDRLTLSQVDKFLSALCRERVLLGMDYSELAPIDGLGHPQFTIAKLIYRVLGYLSQSPYRRL